MIAVIFIVIFLTGYQIMALDHWYLEPYIHSITRISKNADQIVYNARTGVYTITSEKDEFRILQVTDIHLGGSFLSMSKDKLALQAVYRLIQQTKPDFIIVTGDLVFPMGAISFSVNNRAPVIQFAEFMKRIGIPWAFTYGNHDTEASALMDEEAFDEIMKSLSYQNSGNLLYPYIQPAIYGRSNQLIKIRNRNGSLMQALFLLDSNDYITNSRGNNEYDYIHDDQVAWYERQVKIMSKQEGRTIPSMIFFHIPLQEYREAFDLYEQGSPKVTYYYGTIGEKIIDKICTSKYSSSLFDTAVRLKSTKAMFCGHDHYNNLSIEYQGIRLTYGYSIDYLVMPGIAKDVEQRGATLIRIDRNGEFVIEPYQLMNYKD